MKRKMVYLPNEYSKDVVDNINGYFDKGYEIENVFNANEGVYILLVLKDKYKYATNSDSSNCSYTLIEEEKKKGVPTWVTSITNQVKTNECICYDGEIL